MYIEKSVISGMVVAIGAFILLAVAIIYGFTEIHVPKLLCAAIWSTCIFGVIAITDKIERQK